MIREFVSSTEMLISNWVLDLFINEIQTCYLLSVPSEQDERRYVLTVKDRIGRRPENNAILPTCLKDIPVRKLVIRDATEALVFGVFRRLSFFSHSGRGKLSVLTPFISPNCNLLLYTASFRLLYETSS